MKIESRILLALLSCIFLLAACGQKGPLFLPGQSSSFESMIPEQQTETEQVEAEDDEEEERSDNPD